MDKKTEHGRSEGLQIWFCKSCNGTHFRTSNVTLDFSRKEFLELSNAVLGILRSDFTKEDRRQVSNYGGENDDVLLSESVS